MRERPVTVTPETSLSAANDLLTWTRIRCLPVVTDERLVGVISRSDLVRQVVGRSADPEPGVDTAWLFDS